MCGHGTCNEIHQELVNLKFTGTPGVFGLIGTLPCGIILGRERFGKYQNQLNLPGGGMDREDEGCYLKTLMRELMEEIKYCGDWKTLDLIFKSDGVFDYRIHQSGNYCSVIFVGIYKEDSQALVEYCNYKIAEDNSNAHLAFCQRELAYVEVIQGGVEPSAEISKFTLAALQKL